MRGFKTATVIGLALLSTPLGAQRPHSDAGVEDIVIVRSVRLSRIAPSAFCAASHTKFSEATMEDRYDFKAVATDAASGRVTNANGARVGTLHACFGPTSDSLVFNFYAEGEVHTVSLVGRGKCRTTKADFPETGITLYACQLDLAGLPPEYVGGQLTTNTLQSRTPLGLDADPPGYTQSSIATIRLWKKR
ncbi:MAG TPA: hypothetical protein VG456_22405 [Candidatus Sulfopaludibacter sp.]|jgi:hypothetical protein|nr:hypothetical protein [Candidatus Sulfopaludibacter sp.]